MTEKVIAPTVGRVVWYRPHTYEMAQGRHTQPFAAIVTHVWSDECVNLHVFGDHGAHLPSKTSVRFAHGRPAQPGECEWMPHQIGQARAQQAEEVLKAVAVTGTALVTPSGKVLDASEILRQSGPTPTLRDPLGQRCHACAKDDGCAGLMAMCNMQQSRMASAEPTTWRGKQIAGEAAIEAEIQAKGLNAPRLTPADLDAEIVDTEIVKHVSPGGQVLRWCVMTLRNGFAVAGRPSVSVSPENDDAEVGVAVATQNTRNEMWPLLGYALKDRLHRAAGLDGAIKAGLTD